MRRARRHANFFLLVIAGLFFALIPRRETYPARIFEEQFGQKLPASAKNLEAFATTIPNTVITSVWFRTSLSFPDAEGIVSKLGLHEELPDYASETGPPPNVRPWWNEYAARRPERRVWIARGGNVEIGSEYIYAVWEGETFYIYRLGKPLGKVRWWYPGIGDINRLGYSEVQESQKPGAVYPDAPGAATVTG